MVISSDLLILKEVIQDVAQLDESLLDNFIVILLAIPFSFTPISMVSIPCNTSFK